MPEYLRALIALLVLTVPTLWWLRPRLTAAAIDPADYRRRATLWVVLTIALYLAHNFWAFLGVVTIALAWMGPKDPRPLGLYFFLLLLAPPFQSLIPGFGGINYFLGMDYLRLLSAVLLLPITVGLLREPGRARLFSLPADKYLVGYLVLLLALQAPGTSTTDIMRSIVSQALDVWLPYYVFSRGLTSKERFHDAFASFVAAGAVLAVVAIFESGRHWLLYSMLAGVLDVSYAFGGYMNRGDALRAAASTGHAIILGYLLTVATGLLYFLRYQFPSRRSWLMLFGVLGSGIVATFSRGPWVGAAALVCAAIVLSPGVGNRLGKLLMAAFVATPLLLFTPVGAKVLAALPFVGQVDDGSVDYRQQLFTVSWNVLMTHPWFGATDYMANASMEQMRQGEGIIDMVNSYLGVAMFSGFVGLALFAGVFVSCMARLYLFIRRLEDKNSEAFVMGHALLVTLIGVLVMIATLSSISAVPVVYWCLAGACAAFLRMQQESEAFGPVERPQARRPHGLKSSAT